MTRHLRAMCGCLPHIDKLPRYFASHKLKHLKSMQPPTDHLVSGNFLPHLTNSPTQEREIKNGNFFMLSERKREEKEEKKGRKRREEREERKRRKGGKEERKEGKKRRKEGKKRRKERKERKREGRGKEGGKRRKRRWKRTRRREDRGGRTERRIVLQVQCLSVTFFCILI